MPFCSNCGTAVDGRFCSKCGAPAGEAAMPPAPSTPLPLSSTAGGLSDSLAGALCYLGLLITGILFLVLEPYSRNRAVRFHALQAIFLNIAWVVVWFAASLLFGVIHVGVFLSPVIWLTFMFLWIYMTVTTYQGKTVVLPVIGPMARQQA